MFDLVQERDMGSRLAPRTMVYVITHGVTDESGDLSEVGKNQVVDLARSRVVAGITMIYSSSAKDTSSTAKILSKEFGAKTSTKDCLSDVRVGKGTLSAEELAKVLPEMWKDTDYQPEKGESLIEARHRLAECVSGFSGKHKGDSINEDLPRCSRSEERAGVEFSVCVLEYGKNCWIDLGLSRQQ